MVLENDSTVRVLIEESRSTGRYGTEPWLSSVPCRIGTCLSALYYLEGYADRLVNAWKSQALTSEQLYDLVHSTSAGYIAECVAVIDAALGNGKAMPDVKTFTVVWNPLREFIGKLRNRHADFDVGRLVFVFLIATMIVSQDLENKIRGNDRGFCVTTGLKPPVYLEAIAVQNGFRPFSFKEGASLSRLCQSVIRELPTFL